MSLIPAPRPVWSPFLCAGSGGNRRSATPRTRKKPPGRRLGATTRTGTAHLRLGANPSPRGQHTRPLRPFTLRYRASAYRTRMTRLTDYPRYTHPLFSGSLFNRSPSPHPFPLRLVLPFPLSRPYSTSPLSPLMNPYRSRAHVYCAGDSYSTMSPQPQGPHLWPLALASSNYLPTLR